MDPKHETKPNQNGIKIPAIDKEFSRIPTHVEGGMRDLKDLKLPETNRGQGSVLVSSLMKFRDAILAPLRYR